MRMFPAVAVVLLLTACGAAVGDREAGPCALTVRNQSVSQMRGLYVRRPGQPDWGPDRCQGGHARWVLNFEETLTVQGLPEGPCELRAEFANGGACEVPGVVLAIGDVPMLGVAPTP